MLQNIGRNGAILSGFALVSVALIGLTFWGTKSKIDEQRFQRLQSMLTQVMPSANYNNDLMKDCVLVENPILNSQQIQKVYRARVDGETSGFVLESTAPNGYSGNIYMLVGVLIDGTVTGVRVLEHKETPGLGDKIDLRISDWILSFTNQVYSRETSHLWEVKKEGGQFDQFTGATITPRAVVNQVEATAKLVLDDSTDLATLPSNCVTH